MSRATPLLLLPGLLFLGACPGDGSCSVGFNAAAAAVAAHVGHTVPLNYQSGCSGASTASAIAGAGEEDEAVPPAPACSADAEDTACGVVVRVACCKTYDAVCAGLTQAACESAPAFVTCMAKALAANPSACGRATDGGSS